MIPRSKKGGVAAEQMPPELLPCRFCGHDGEGVQYALDDGDGRWQVACLMCGTHGPSATTMSESRHLWNLPIADHQALHAALRAARYLRAG